MKKLILVCGPAGIGKSTFCQNYTKQHPLEKVVRISSDEIRLKLTKSYRNFPKLAVRKTQKRTYVVL